MKVLAVLGVFVFVMLFARGAWGEDENPFKPTFLTRTGFFVGTGGSVPTQGSLSGGGEIIFFRDDYNHELSVSADIFKDRTVQGTTDYLVPLFFNYRWFAGAQKSKGLFFTAGLGEAVPFNYGHGGGSFAWQAGGGYFFSRRFGVDLRYIGRRSQTVTFNGTPLQVNPSFFGLTTSMSLF